jgi:hypothetical protein
VGGDDYRIDLLVTTIATAAASSPSGRDRLHAARPERWNDYGIGLL